MPPMGRIDTRPQNDPAVAAGMRSIHSGMDGKAIGGYTAEGQAVGTKAASTFRRDPSKWMIDSYDREGTAVKANRMAEQKQRNLSGRKSLFRDMQMAGSGGLTPEMRQRASQLGVDEQGYQRGVAKLNPEPVMLSKPSRATKLTY